MNFEIAMDLFIPNIMCYFTGKGVKLRKTELSLPQSPSHIQMLLVKLLVATSGAQLVSSPL